MNVSKKLKIKEIMKISDTMESAGFERWVFRFETEKVTFVLIIIDYIAIIYNIYTMLHFFGDFSCRFGRKIVQSEIN